MTPLFLNANFRTRQEWIQISLEKLGSFMILANNTQKPTLFFLLEDQVRTPHLQNRINKHV